MTRSRAGMILGGVAALIAMACGSPSTDEATDAKATATASAPAPGAAKPVGNRRAPNVDAVAAATSLGLKGAVAAAKCGGIPGCSSAASAGGVTVWVFSSASAAQDYEDASGIAANPGYYRRYWLLIDYQTVPVDGRSVYRDAASTLID